MRKLRTIITSILICSILVITNTVFTNDVAVAQASTNIRLNENSITLELGHYQTLKVYGTTQKVTWKSGNTKVATVSGTGIVSAKAVGSTTITASVGGKKLTAKVTVLRLHQKNLTLTPGQKSTLKLTGTTSPITWSTSDESVVTVTSTGSITAVAPGSALVTASVDGKHLICNITVVSLHATQKVMEVGGFSGYTFTVKMLGTTDKATWTSSNPSVASVSKSGVVSALKAGSTTITATINGVSLTCDIKVLSENLRSFTLKMGDTQKLQILGTTSEVRWHSNKRSVALVSSDGTVSTVAPGSAIIMAYVDGRNVKARVTVVK